MSPARKGAALARDQFLTAIESKAKAVAAALGAALGVYVVTAIQAGTALTWTGLVGALVASPIVGRWVHQVSNAEE